MTKLIQAAAPRLMSCTQRKGPYRNLKRKAPGFLRPMGGFWDLLRTLVVWQRSILQVALAFRLRVLLTVVLMKCCLR